MKSFLKGLLKNTQTYIRSEGSENVKKIVLRGNQKTQVIHKIEQVVFQAKFQPISTQMEDICEKVHFQVMNDQPVRVDYLQKLLPAINFNNYNDESYNEWLRYKHNMDSEQSEVILDKQKSVEGESNFNNMGQTNQVINQKDVLNAYKKQK